MMKKLEIALKMCKVMEGFATKPEILDEINGFLSEGYSLDEAEKAIYANIAHWLRWASDKAAYIVWDRMDKLGIKVFPEFCTK